MRLDKLNTLSITQQNDILNWFENPVTKAFFEDMAEYQSYLHNLILQADANDAGHIGEIQGKIKLSKEMAHTLAQFKEWLLREDEDDEGFSGFGNLFDDIGD